MAVETTMLAAALAYAELGWMVFPLAPNTKVPLISKKQGGKGVHDATTSPDKIRAWWSAEPNANVGIATGAPSGFDVIDIDPYKGEDWEPQQPLDTAMQITARGGRHLLVMHRGIRPSKPHRFVDIKSTGGYIVAWPSTWKGLSYEWEASSNPLEGQGIAECPPELLIEKQDERATYEQSSNFYPRIAAKALQYLDADDYDTWIEMGQCLHSTGHEKAREVWDWWSKKSEKFDLGTQNEKWATFDGRAGLTMGTLYWRAEGEGWPGYVDFEFSSGADEAAQPVQLSGGKQGPHRSLKNLIEILTRDVRWKGTFRFNEFAHRVEVCEPHAQIPVGILRDVHLTAAAMEMDEVYGFAGGPPSRRTIHEAIEYAAHLNTHHPVRDYLDSLKWDGTERVSHALCDLFGAPPEDYTLSVSTAFLVAAVTRIYFPGCKFDSMLVLEGKQGVGKSRTVAALFSEDWTCDSPIDFGSKDAVQIMTGKWGIEVAELVGFSRKDASALKQVFSSAVDTVRLPYARLAEDIPRQSVFVGTTNDTQYLRDATGGRRYWPVRVTQCQPELAVQLRDQLWAEAVELMRAGHPTWLPSEMQAEQARHADERYMTDDIQEAIETALGDSDRIALADLYDALGAKEVRDRSPQLQSGILKTMTRLGYVKRKARCPAHPHAVWAYVKAE